MSHNADVADPGPAQAVNLRRETYDLYIGRPGKGQKGPWGNPFRLEKEKDRPQVLDQYRRWLEAERAAGRITDQALAELHGKRLGCFCAPKLCHGTVLAEAAAEAWRKIHADY